MSDELLSTRAGHIYRNRETDAHVAIVPAENGRVDSDEPTCHVDQRPTGVTRIDRCVCLDEILIAFDAQIIAPNRAHNAESRGLPNAERITDRYDIIADLQSLRSTER